MFSAFRSRDYAFFWTGAFVSSVGSWMQSIALGWLIYQMTDSASWLGVVSFAGNAPSLFLGLVGGAVADRTDRRLALVGTQGIAALSAFLLAVLTAVGVLRLWQVVALALASGVAMALYLPVLQATIPALVPVEHLLNAVSLNAVQFNIARAVGPLAAGLLYGRIGAAGCFFLNAISFLALMAVFASLRIPARAAVTAATLRRELLDGLRYAASERLIVAMLSLAATMSFFGFPYIILMPAVARDTLHLGPEGLGILMAAVGVGAVAGGLTLASVGDVARKALVATASATLFGTILCLFTLASTLAAAVPALFVLGASQVACTASLNTTLQITVDDRMRGRVMSMLTIALFGLSTLGSLILGLLGDRLGVPAVLRCGGVVILAAAALITGRAPELFEPVFSAELPAGSR